MDASVPTRPRLAAQCRAAVNWFKWLTRQTARQNALYKIVLAQPRFAPLPRFAGLDVPRLETARDLADWLGLSLEHLDWFADTRRQQGRTLIPDLQHYTYVLARKSHGAPRLIEAPKPQLKAIQTKLLRSILDQVPLHEAAHGFVRGRSCLTGAHLHAGEDTVITADLKDFFPSTPVARVHTQFRQLGYPGPVARLLTGLCTTMTPPAIFDRLPADQRPAWLAVKLFGAPHLPQGALTSPALANLAACGLDIRLSGLARACHARYTRYADDLAFSGDVAFGRRAKRLIAIVTDIAADEGYAVHPHKVRVMHRDGRQQVTGVVVNAHTNAARHDFDTLKAVLHNCARSGPQSQNRDKHADFRAHLSGRVGWVEHLNPARGVKLRRMFEQIVWT
jgi:RNA-directed DNA polymerase